MSRSAASTPARRTGCWIAVALPILLMLGGSLAILLQAPTWRITRTRVIAASPGRVGEVLLDVRKFAACCAPSEARAPTGATIFSPTERGAGAWLEWGPAGARERGTIESTEPGRVTMRYDVAGRSSRQTIEWVALDADRTQVTWTLEGNKSGLRQRILWPVAGLERRLGASIETALVELDRAAR